MKYTLATLGIVAALLSPVNGNAGFDRNDSGIANLLQENQNIPIAPLSEEMLASLAANGLYDRIKSDPQTKASSLGDGVLYELIIDGFPAIVSFYDVTGDGRSKGDLLIIDTSSRILYDEGIDGTVDLVDLKISSGIVGMEPSQEDQSAYLGLSHAFRTLGIDRPEHKIK
tara:strand:+ start:921 stop:1430 length:510 start_codon:yes stop_codon:yes gene_type:complete